MSPLAAAFGNYNATYGSMAGIIVFLLWLWLTNTVLLLGAAAARSVLQTEDGIQLTGHGELFMLRVSGDSMIDAAICDGDWVVVRAQATAENGEIVAALLDDEATVKTFRQRDGHTWLLPQNSQYEPILGDHATVMGKVVSVLRSL